VGGGGLAAGVAVAMRGADPSIRVVGAQAEAVAPFPASIRAGHPVTVASGPTMADGIAVARPGALAVEIMAALAGRVVTVSEENLSRALLICLERAKQVVEPAGAAGVAALLEHPQGSRPPVLAVLGANVLDVVHERFTPHLHVDEVEVLLQVETRGPGHCDSVIGQLRQAGYKLRFS